MLPDPVKKESEIKLSEKFGEKISLNDFSPASGGCINNGGKVESGSGSFFIKWNHASLYPEMFEKERKGLNILKGTGNINIPQPLVCGEADNFSFLIMEYLHPGSPVKNFWSEFGQRLAALHRNPADQFGLDHHNYIGSLPQSNREHARWIDFFIEERLEKQLKIGRDNIQISQAHVQKFESLYKKFPSIFPEEKPSLLHGDLWNGNFMVGSDGLPVLIDPAVYYGHREADLAFTRLFGGFEPDFYDSYHKHFPLEKGFDQRRDIYNLYPLLVHVNLFGGSYLHSVEKILEKFL